MSVEFSPKIRCSICGTLREETNHWFRVWPEGTLRVETSEGSVKSVNAVIIATLHPTDIETRGDLIIGEEQACGSACLNKLIARLTGKPVEAKPPPRPAKSQDPAGEVRG